MAKMATGTGAERSAPPGCAHFVCIGSVAATGPTATRTALTFMGECQWFLAGAVAPALAASTRPTCIETAALTDQRNNTGDTQRSVDQDGLRLLYRSRSIGSISVFSGSGQVC